MNGPENPGNSLVERFEWYSWLSITDYEQGIRVRLYDALNTWRCEGDADDPLWDYQDVLKEFEVFTLRTHEHSGEIPIVVYPFPNNPDKTFCEFLAEDWLYKGTGQARSHDNNVLWWTGTGGTNSYGWRVNGTVQDRGGNMYKVVGNTHYTVRGLCCYPDVPLEDEWVEFMSIIESVKIHPIQNGKK